MIRSVLAGFLLLFVAVSSASAQTCAAYPNPLANNTNADATQVMANFNLIRDCANNSLAARSGATFGSAMTTTNLSPQVTINTTGSKPLVVGDGTSGNGIMIGYSGNTIQARTSPALGTNGNLILNDVGGFVGIGTTSPTFTLHVNGSVAGTSAYNNVSDARLKKDIASLEYGLDTIMKLRPVGFNWIAQDQEWKKQHQVGLIAQEVESVVPEAVTTANDKLQTKSLAYGELVPVLIKAVQELKSANDNLRAANDNGAAQIVALTARLDAIEAAHTTKAAASSPSLLR